MIIEDVFPTLSLKEQLHLVFEKGSLISTVSDATSAVSLYHIDDYFAELHYRINHAYSFGLWEIERIELRRDDSRGSECLDKYLGSINLNALLAA